MGLYDEDFLLGDADEVAEIHTPTTLVQNFMLASIPVMIVVGLIEPVLYAHATSNLRLAQFAALGIVAILIGTAVLGLIIHKIVTPRMIARLNKDKGDEILEFRNKVFGRTGIELTDFEVAYLASEKRKLIRLNSHDQHYLLHSYEDAGTLRMEAVPISFKNRSTKV